MSNRFLVPVLITGMILTGACNSIWSKYQDMQCVENCDDPDPNAMSYTSNLYGRLSRCSLPSQRLTGWRILLLWLPALCDLTGTTLMNIGLLYTPVSIYQMTRGALVLFVGILSVLFLRRRLHLYQWLSLLAVMAGVSLVGFSGSLIKDTLRPVAPSLLSMLDSTPTNDLPATDPIDHPEASKVLIGVFFILFAQIFTAAQFVVEEKILGRYSVPPLLAPPPSSNAAAWFDLVRGWHQLVDTPSVLYSGIVIACSIALFNFFGLSVTKYVSATARSLTDTCRTLAIWIVSLGLGWEVLMWPISLLQVVGFGLLVYSTFLFNNLVQPPRFLRPSERDSSAAIAASVLVEQKKRAARLPAGLGTGGYNVVPPEGQGATRNRNGQ
ncbi:hypothetical protein B0F90DRAFT_1698097 [Multifurca ochricompacta]|uniref:EamA domain-containing protein n=1 Tax=Multifurca ochricompacta TaxID=376703 RepID=A0AAD4QQK1_9AGAM|nr:hypothetical protein B0F90DRAFT_1698097 [Multifurca ochricompacta]